MPPDNNEVFLLGLDLLREAEACAPQRLSSPGREEVGAGSGLVAREELEALQWRQQLSPGPVPSLLWVWAISFAFFLSFFLFFFFFVFLSYTTATVTRDPSCVCDLHHRLWQCGILNPLSEARDRTHNLMVSSRIR